MTSFLTAWNSLICHNRTRGCVYIETVVSEATETIESRSSQAVAGDELQICWPQTRGSDMLPNKKQSHQTDLPRTKKTFDYRVEHLYCTIL